MKEITGTIDHRILLNYRIDPEVMKRRLPPEFEPMVVNGWAIGGICQVSLSHMRPKGLPALATTRSHNAAHRIAVETSHGPGVYVPRRDTNSWLNALSGGRLFPGVYEKSDFDVDVDSDCYKVSVVDGSGHALMSIEATVTDQLPDNSTFESVEAISSFFESGNIGWSTRKNRDGFEAIELKTVQWRMEPMVVHDEFSRYFTDPDNFPRGSVQFDSAMIMRGLQHSWISRENMCELCC